ncbi:MAG: hypothetical protein R6T96_00420 [Longimicrobiales bacterium]
MHLLLTDRITCPRCGPEFGLILLAHEVRDRRVIRGNFGCANCRETYPIEGGFGDLRAPPRTPLQELSVAEKGPVMSALEEGGEAALRLAALMGVTGGPGTLLLTGAAAAHAGDVSRLIGGIEAVAVDPSLRSEEPQEGVSRMVSRPGLPFFSGTFKGAVVSGEVGRDWVSEAARVVAPNCRVVVLDAPEGARGWLESGGLRPILEEGGILVALREGGQRVPPVPLRRP